MSIVATIYSLSYDMDTQILYTGLAIALAVAAVLAVLVLLLMKRTARLSRYLADLVPAENRPAMLRQADWWPRFRLRTYIAIVCIAVVGIGLVMAERRRLAAQYAVFEYFAESNLEGAVCYDWGMLGDTKTGEMARYLTNEYVGRTVIEVAIGQDASMSEPTGVTDADLAQIARWRSLQGIYLGAGNYSAKGFTMLTELPGLKRIALSKVDLDGMIAVLAKSESLESITLIDCTVTPEQLVELAKLPHLKQINLEGIHIDDKFLAVIESLASIEFAFFQANNIADREDVPGNVLQQSEEVLLLRLIESSNPERKLEGIDIFYDDPFGGELTEIY